MPPSSESKAPDDPGAFGMLRPDQKRVLKGAMYVVGARLAQRQRSTDEWSISLLVGIHRDLFGGLFPEHAAKLRRVDVSFRGHTIPVPEQVLYRLSDIVGAARDIIEEANSIGDDSERIQAVLLKIARLHADCVVVQPFIDGNKRWARQVLSALLVDCGFWPGSRIDARLRERYMAGIDKSVAGDHEQLAELIIDGWYRLREDFMGGLH
jgi:fido (protein-threonine AMPylation protein)